MEDFDIMLPEINSNALLDKWTHMKENIIKLSAPIFDSDFDEIDPDINDLLALYKRLQPKRIDFRNAVNSLIIFNQVTAGFCFSYH